MVLEGEKVLDAKVVRGGLVCHGGSDARADAGG